MAKRDMIPAGNSNGDRKLESWKEIAAFFDRDLRTVIRWEKELGLPVHRYPGKAKGRVYALASELQAWADGPRRAIAGAASPVDAASATLETSADSGEVLPNADSVRTQFVGRRGRWLAVAVGLIVVVALLGAVALHFSRLKSITSVAVLPFDNPGGQSDPAFVEGLTDEIAASISRLKDVRVAGRSSAYALSGKGNDLRQLGKTLNVEAVIEGSVRRSGNHTRVTVQLDRTADGFTIWAETYDSDGADLIQIESQIAANVAKVLSRGGSPIETVPATSNAEARALYLQGRYLWNQRNLESEQKSVDFMRRAIALDPGYAQAWSGLADSLMTIGNLEMVRPVDYLPEARKAARKALELDPNLADAHAVLGRIAAHYDYDWATAENEYKKALALNPNYVTAHQYYALGLMAHGRLAEAQQQLDIARQLDPLALVVGVDLALLRKFQRDYKGVIEESKRVLQLDPNYRIGYSMLTTGYILTEQWKEWLAVDAREKLPNGDLTRAIANGDMTKAHQVLDEEKKQVEQGELTAVVVVAHAVRLGEYNLALDWLDRSYQNHDYWLLFLNVDPEMDPIRNDPRFQSMMKRLGVA